MSTDWQKERIVKNEVSFRAINERLEEGLRQVPASGQPFEFVCECGSRECTDMVRLTLDQYEAARRHPRRFAVLRGHLFPEVERVVEEHDAYTVVEKFVDAPEG